HVRGYSAYSAAAKIDNKENFDPEAIAAENDFAALMAARNFLMIYPTQVMSSCILEAGYAFIAGIPYIYFVGRDEDLPYMLRGAVESFRNTRRVRFREEREVIDFFVRYPNIILGDTY